MSTISQNYQKRGAKLKKKPIYKNTRTVSTLFREMFVYLIGMLNFCSKIDWIFLNTLEFKRNESQWMVDVMLIGMG